jgi:hypothetical protein
VYTPPSNIMSGQRHRPHTNAVIEAGNIRARDEVTFSLSPRSREELTSRHSK